MQNRLKRLQAEEQRCRSRVEVARKKAEFIESKREISRVERKKKENWRNM